ncbi:MAG: hypothetical protein AB7I27_15190 [Bacteriovoracaceae bacterium]
MRINLTIFFLLMVLNTLAAEKDIVGFNPRKDIISDKYDAGAYLIYDCEEKHWTCVLESHFNLCEEDRKEDLENKKKDLRCAPIGAFPNKRSCFQRQLYMVSNNFGDRFCLNDSWKEKEIELSRF